MQTRFALGLTAALFTLIACSSNSDSTGPTPTDGKTPDVTDPSTTDPPGTSTPPGKTGSTDPGETPFVWTPPVIATESAACAASASPETGTRDYTTPSGRTYHVMWPANFDASKKYPLLFAFHGLEAQGLSFASWVKVEKHLSSANETANHEAIVIYPDGAADWDIGSDKDLKFFDEMVAQIGASTCFNPQYVYALGFSWGGYFVDYLACNRAGYVRAVAIGDAGSLGAYQRCGRVPIIITSRTADQNEQLYKGQKNYTDWTTYFACGADKSAADGSNCFDASGCSNPGAVTFCEDTYSYLDHAADFASPVNVNWEHTIRPEYQFRSWTFLKAH